MLIGNGVRYGGSPMRTMGGAQIGSAERGRWGDTGGLKCFYSGEATVIGGASIANKSAFPNGHNRPSAWILAPKAGGISSYSDFAVTSTFSATIVAGVALASQVDGEAAFSLTLQLQAHLSGQIDGEALFSCAAVGSAPVSGSIAAASAWSGSLIALANITGLIAADVTFAGDLVAGVSSAATIAAVSDWSGTLSPLAILSGAIAANSDWSASLVNGYGIGGAIAVVSDWSGTPTAIAYAAGTINAVATFSMGSSAIGYVSGEISSNTELSPDSLAAAVWDYATRTLTGLGALSSDQDDRLRELWQVLGLDPDAPLTVTTTRRYVGDSGTPDIDQTIAGNGRTLSTVTRAP